jgi:hypothetical protein
MDVMKHIEGTAHWFEMYMIPRFYARLGGTYVIARFVDGSDHSFASPFSTSLSNVKASTAKATMFAVLSLPHPVSSSLLYVPCSLLTARAT